MSLLDPTSKLEWLPDTTKEELGGKEDRQSIGKGRREVTQGTVEVVAGGEVTLVVEVVARGEVTREGGKEIALVLVTIGS